MPFDTSLPVPTRTPAPAPAPRQGAPGDASTGDVVGAPAERPLNLSFDAADFSAASRRGPSSPYDPADFERVWRDELAPKLKLAPEREKGGFAIQEVRYADMIAGGRETNLVFERDPGNYLPATGIVQQPMVDPRTGQAQLQLREMRVRVSAGAYDVIVDIDGEGQPSFNKVYYEGRNVTSIAGDFVKRKIKEDPWVWGTAAAAAAVGAVAYAHNQVKKTGEPIGFDVAKVTLWRDERWEVKAKARAELTGDSRFVRPAGGEVGVAYHDGRLNAGLGARYRTRTDSVELAASMNYQVDKTSTLSASASYNPQTKGAIGILYESRF